MNGPLAPVPEGIAQTDAREAASAIDLLDHPGYADVLRDAMREAKAARKVLFGEATPDQYAHARGSLAVIKNLVLAVYRRANREVPANIESLFQ